MFELSSLRKKTVVVIGDAMIDEWVNGKVMPSQDGCCRFDEHSTLRLPGGAANAGRSLKHWDTQVFLVALGVVSDWHGLDASYSLHQGQKPHKTRYVDQDGRIVFRRDLELPDYGLPRQELCECREQIVRSMRDLACDAVYLSDYAKGVFDDQLIQKLIRVCDGKGIPVVVDPKRSPHCCADAVLKCNADYCTSHCGLVPGTVVTRGAQSPTIIGTKRSSKEGPGVLCVNHVGAGDCFGAHLALALGSGFSLEAAVDIAHAAGRVYVQHPHNRPPWPCEVGKQLDPRAGKVIRDARDWHGEGKVVFTNGVFRIPHAGHVWLLNWAKDRGDTLVVGVNDDASATALRPGEFIMPLEERLEVLSSLSCVDWVMPFSGLDPCELMRQVKPDVMVKGSEYRGQHVPGEDLVNEVAFAPDSPYVGHCADLVAAVRG